jgi:hypothetical protein
MTLSSHETIARSIVRSPARCRARHGPEELSAARRSAYCLVLFGELGHERFREERDVSGRAAGAERDRQRSPVVEILPEGALLTAFTTSCWLTDHLRPLRLVVAADAPHLAVLPRGGMAVQLISAISWEDQPRRQLEVAGRCAIAPVKALRARTAALQKRLRIAEQFTATNGPWLVRSSWMVRIPAPAGSVSPGSHRRWAAAAISISR